MIQALIRRVKKSENDIAEIENIAAEIAASNDTATVMETARGLYASKVTQARILATYLLGKIAARSKESLAFLHLRVSQDEDKQVQEALAQAFDQFCKDFGYDRALPIIRDWLADSSPHARRAVIEGLRVWTTRPYFDEHPQVAIQLLSPMRTDTSEIVRKSVGNALRDISKMHKDLIKAELKSWDLSDRHVQQVHKLASRLLK
jgi:3-methyladenine DNA glycosylase AlkC